ncbi:MAG: hypothetical protein R3B91_08865 [Planctomycetaceae bacterium]
MADSTSETTMVNGVTLWISVSIQLACWGVALMAMVAYTRRSMSALEDFGVEVSRNQLFVIMITDWLVGKWFISLPMLAGIVIGSTYVAFAFLQTGTLRWIWTIASCVVPFACSGWMYLTIRPLFSLLQNDMESL